MSASRLTGAMAVGAAIAVAACAGGRGEDSRTAFTTQAGAMAVLTLGVSDGCQPQAAQRVTAQALWVDGRHVQDILLYPGSGLDRYQALAGPLSGGRHRFELRPSEFWPQAGCLTHRPIEAAVIQAGTPEDVVARHAPVLELRADTIGEQTDVPLYAYVERLPRDGAVTWRYTVVFSNEDGGTPTRALLARWGRTTDIEQVYDVTTSGDRVTREEFQGPDHEIRAFTGRRVGEAPILLVATMNNMVIDRGRGVVAVRPVPAIADLSRATRESTMDARPWVYRFMERELAAEGRIADDAPEDDEWARRAPGPRAHVFLEARLRLDRAVAVAWVRGRDGARHWSHYDKASLAIDRDGWVRTAVAAGPGGPAAVVEVGWACLAPPDEAPTGSCEIDATRAFALTADGVPGPNLVAPGRLVLKAGGEARLTSAGAPGA